MDEAEDLSKDPVAFPDFTDHLIADLRTSLELFLEDAMWSEKADYRELLQANHLYLNDRLKKFYGPKSEVTVAGNSEGSSCAPQSGEGVAQVVGAKKAASEFEKVTFDKNERSGVLTHPYLLSALAYYKSTSPIHRGVFLTRNIVGRSLKPPPAAIQFMDGKFDPKMTMREKVTELTSPAACQGCHVIINPLGFSLEKYDGVGRFRDMENGRPVDATSEYQASDGEILKLTGARDVAEHAVASEDAQRGFVRQMFQHLVKQPAPAYGAETLVKLSTQFAANEYNMQRLLVEIAQMAALRGVEKQKE
jgi:hypothetical protein